MKNLLFISALFLTALFFSPATLSAMPMEHHHSGAMTPVDHLEPAINPEFPVGSLIIIHTDHMQNMTGAFGSVSGAFNTTVYAVDYVDSVTGEKVLNHKWVIHEEIKDSTGKTYSVGDQVILESEHMSGMKGVVATISQVVPGPVYMVDYFPNDNSPEVTNHQWVIGSEISRRN